ncbi:MAG: YARHG domain-containing protein [Eubacteriales bacterium]|nr:YARHG domain-containing protein [Eubacteriales bacterium]
MRMIRRFLALVLALCLMLPLCAGALAEGITFIPLEAASVFKQGAYASEGEGTVYFTVAGSGNASLYAVPSAGGAVSLLETQDDIQDLIAVGDAVYYLRSVSGVWQLVCLNASNLSVINVFAPGANVQGLGYYDGKLYVICNSWLYSFNVADGAETLVSDQEMSDFAILGGRIYYISGVTERTYTRSTSDGEQLSVSAGCLYSMALDGTDILMELETGVTDIRGYGEHLYCHNMSDNYPVASSTGEKWLDGRLYRYSIVTETFEKAHDNYDWDFYPTSNGLLLYTLGSIDLKNVTEGTSINLLKPEQYTSVTVDGEFAFVYQHTAQSLTRVPTNGETPTVLGSGLPTAGVKLTELDENGAAVSPTLAPAATKKPTSSATKKPSAPSASGDYIFPNSSTKKLTTSDLKKVDPTLWAYGRNEIWARHGYEFNKKIYADYFASKSWYKPGGYSSSDLNSIEWYNMDFIKKYEEIYKDEIAELNAGATKKPSTTKKPATDSTYIFPNSSTQKLTKADILSIDRSLWGYARNEIWARHGYEFNKKIYADYFATKTWYKPGGFSTKDLNDIEWYNMDLIKAMEAQY